MASIKEHLSPIFRLGNFETAFVSGKYTFVKIFSRNLTFKHLITKFKLNMKIVTF